MKNKRKIYLSCEYGTTETSSGAFSNRRLIKEDYLKYQQTLSLYRKIVREGSGLVSKEYFDFMQRSIRSFRAAYFNRKPAVKFSAKFKPLPHMSFITVSSYSLRDLKGRIRNEIHCARLRNSQVRVISREYHKRSYGYFTVTRVGGVHAEPGFWLKLRHRKDLEKVFQDKYPLTSERHVGIELEFIAEADSNKLGLALVEAGVTKYVTLKTDASIQGAKAGQTSHELTLCIPEALIDSVVKRVTQVLTSVKARVNSTTGMHVHLDARYRDHRKMFSRLVSAQRILFAMQPKSRRDNKYCRANKTKVYNKARRTIDRYHGVNPLSYSEHRTIEVRLHSGTVSFEKIVNWVKILISVVDQKSKTSIQTPRTVDNFCKTFGIGDELRAYIQARVNKFKSIDVEESA